jgi:6,7-dimethyl-8-ribityllumazine synthase
MNQIATLHTEVKRRAREGSRPPRVAVIASSWHREIVASPTEAIRAEFARRHLPADGLAQFEVPGSFEIPLHARRCGPWSTATAETSL